MLEFIANQIIFYAAIIYTLFVPGYFLVLAIFGRKADHSIILKLLLSVGFSFASVNIIFLVFSAIGIEIDPVSAFIGIAFFSIFCYGVFRSRKFKKDEEKPVDQQSFFSKRQLLSIILIVFLTIFLKSLYLDETIFPTSTDLGHHMYWSKEITETGKIPTYKESDIIEVNGSYAISEPERIADFIVGEHIVFAIIALLSGASFISSFPSLVLLIFNFLTIFSIFILSLEIFRYRKDAVNISILVLLFAGPLYALSSPQAKYVSGGVVGNTIGNFLIPLILLFYIKAFNLKSRVHLSIAMFLTLGLAYTHHLSSFVFLFGIIFSMILYSIVNWKIFFSKLLEWLKMLFSPQPLLVVGLIVFLLLLIHVPSYLNFEAVDTAVGTPTKSTRTGLKFSELMFTVGQARFIFGLIGIAFILIKIKRKMYGGAFLVGWAVALMTMSLQPQWLYVDIPSNRIASYTIFPFIILSAYGVYSIFLLLKDNKFKNLAVRPIFSLGVFFLIMTFFMTTGMRDNSSTLNEAPNAQSAVQTFRSAEYLADRISNEDIVLKDHNYMTADTWMKMFFSRDYNFPFSRSYFKRYDDPLKDREQCTLVMISTPKTELANKCYEGTGTNFLVVNPTYDGAQFERIEDFWKIYESDEVSIYHKNRL